MTPAGKEILKAIHKAIQDKMDDWSDFQERVDERAEGYSLEELAMLLGQILDIETLTLDNGSEEAE